MGNSSNLLGVFPTVIGEGGGNVCLKIFFMIYVDICQNLMYNIPKLYIGEHLIWANIIEYIRLLY